MHRGSLEHATRAIYDEEALANVSPERLERYFTKLGERYQVVPELRQMVVFAQHNVIKDAPFTRVDLVTCRNLLIYLQPAAQQKVLSLFHFALNRGGVLFLGPSETVGALSTASRPSTSTGASTENAATPACRSIDARLSAAAGGAAPPCRPFNLRGGRYSLSQLLGTYDALLERTMPPSLLVNERGELVHAFGGAGRSCSIATAGRGSTSSSWSSPELKMVLVGGLKRAIDRAVGDRLPGRSDLRTGSRRRLQGHASSASAAGAAERPTCWSRSSKRPRRRRPSRRPRPRSRWTRSRATSCGPSRPSSRTPRRTCKRRSRSWRPATRSCRPPTKSSRRRNEELQSTNEELQSVNEELYTVNAEYQRKIGELTELTNDMDNLLASTEIGTIFLDAELKIRKFTPQIAKAFSLVPHDVGRSIETFVHQMKHPELVEDLNRVLATGAAGRARARRRGRARPSIRGSSPTAPRGRSAAWSSPSST